MLSSATMMVNRDVFGVPASIGDMLGVAVTRGGDIATPVDPGVGNVGRVVPVDGESELD